MGIGKNGERLRLTAFLQNAQQELAQKGVDNPQLDARLLVAQALGCDRLQLALQPERVLTVQEIATLQSLIDRRANREPVARIFGLREFWGLPFALNEATLEPRPDSETLISVCTEQASNTGQAHHETPMIPNPCLLPSVLDLGTGTGCLLLALLHEMPNATGLGLDIAPRAVDQARQNAERLGLSSRATFRVNNWLEGITDCFDIILSNPPYIAHDEIVALMPEVREHDPMVALDGGKDGLDIYRHLIPQLPRHLNPNGFVVFEVGQGQAKSVSALLRIAGFSNVTVRKDFGGIERCVAAKR
jgi:release factor glutamine methyltransferase